MKKVLITGITGQDGIFLTNTIINNQEDYYIHGISRNKNSNTFFEKLKSLGLNDFSRIKIDEVNLLNEADVNEYLQYVSPSFIYNLAGPSSVYKSFQNPDEVSLQINGIFDNLINSMIKNNNFPNFFQASSSEMFGDNGKEYQDETGIFLPNSPYAASKLQVHKKIQKLRQEYDFKLVSGIMFNHESELRTKEYLIMKIINYAKNLQTVKNSLTLGSLDYVRDWSFAGDIANCMYSLNENNINEDFVIGSGKGKKILDILEIIFSEVNKEWEEFVEIDSSLLRIGDPKVLVANPKKLFTSLNWKPELNFESLILRCFKLSN
tara:strand:+ start:598 stop:1560 length:963 start_codon:yes stop_codon:yes gene_type:complete